MTSAATGDRHRMWSRGKNSARQLSAAFLICCCWFVPGEATICAGLTYYTANTTTATFTSPDYPSDYGINVFCSWLIEATDSTHTIRLTVDTSSLESADGNGDCTYDYARVYDGNDMSASLLGDWCDTATQTLYSTGTTMMIVFRSDFSVVSTGFSASYLSGSSWTTATSSKDYTIIIIACSCSGFVLICSIIAIICCCKAKKRRARRAMDKQKLQDGEEGGNEKYQSEGGKSLFTQRIIPSRHGARLQPLEAAVQPETSAVAKVMVANAAAAAAARDKELKEKQKQEKKREKEKLKAEKEEEKKREKEKQKAEKEEAKRKAAEEQRKSAREKTAKARRGNTKRVGFEEVTEDIGASKVVAGTVAVASSQENTGKDDTSTPLDTNNEDKPEKGQGGWTSNFGEGGGSSKKAARIVLLPTVVTMDGSGESAKRTKVAGQWDQVPVNPPQHGKQVKVKDGQGSIDGDRAQTAQSMASLEKDEGIHMDFESGKSSPTSRPSTTATTLPRDNTVLTPSLVTSIIADTPNHQPVPIEAPAAAENLVDGPQRASTAGNDRSDASDGPPFPVKNAFNPGSVKEDPFLAVEDQDTTFRRVAPITLDRRGKPVKAAGRGRNTVSR